MAVLPVLYLAVKSPDANNTWQQTSNHEFAQSATGLINNNSSVIVNDEPHDSLNTDQSANSTNRNNKDIARDASAIADNKMEIAVSNPSPESITEIEKIVIKPTIEASPAPEPTIPVNKPVIETSITDVTNIGKSKVASIKSDATPVTKTNAHKPTNTVIAAKTVTPSPTTKKPEPRIKALVAPEKPKSEPKVAIITTLPVPPLMTTQTEMVEKDIKDSAAQTNPGKIVVAKQNVFHTDNLQMIVSQFTGAYKGGDLTRLSSILSDDIKTNDSDDKATLTAQYKKLFSITDDRELKFTNVSWQTHIGSAAGEGKFEATILEKGRVKPQIFAGTFTMNIEQRNAQLAITDMRYEYSY